MKMNIQLNKAEVEALLLNTYGVFNGGKVQRVEDLACYFYSTGGGYLHATITDEPLPATTAEPIPDGEGPVTERWPEPPPVGVTVNADPNDDSAF